jgi:hypothetical protein
VYNQAPGEVTNPDTKVAMVRVLNEYAKCGVIGLACDRAGVYRNDHKKWLETYPKYKELFETLKERFVDGLEEVAIQRAREKSDSLMIFLLKAHKPDVYGDKIDANLNVNQQPITLTFAEGMLSEREKALLTEGMEVKEDNV